MYSLLSYDKFFGDDDSAWKIDIPQAGAQIAAIVVALVLALFSGALTGLLLKLKIWDNLTADELYEDETFWSVS